ncbi:unnamed protein product, partial [Musa acuminata var. zebrina]
SIACCWRRWDASRRRCHPPPIRRLWNGHVVSTRPIIRIHSYKKHRLVSIRRDWDALITASDRFTRTSPAGRVATRSRVDHRP